MYKISVLACKMLMKKTFVQGSPEEEREGGEASNLCCPAGAERRPRSLPEDCRQGNFPPVSLVVASSTYQLPKDFPFSRFTTSSLMFV
jgi:hypothetical protein